MTWVLVAIGGSAAIGAGASYLGSKKQAKASEKAGELNMDMFNILNRQQSPYIQSGYGAMQKLNTLLGLNPAPRAPGAGSAAPPQFSPGQSYMPTPGGGVQPIMQLGPSQAPQAQAGADPRQAQVVRMRELLRSRGMRVF